MSGSLKPYSYFACRCGTGANPLQQRLKAFAVVSDSNRLRSLLFKWCVELNMACHTIAAHFGDEEIDRRELRGYAAQEVKETCGQISFDNALDIHRQL